MHTRLMMESKEEEEESSLMWEPVSPSGYYLKSSTLCLTITAVMEFQSPVSFDDTCFFSLVRDLFLPINPRFSSIMVEEKNRVKKWKKVNVNLENHITIPTFPKIENPPHLYDKYFNTYLANLAASQFPQNQPLWEIHLVKYPTTAAAGHVIFKLHHALGDGYSLVGALLSCLQRLDNPSMPLTFPSLRSQAKINDKNSAALRFVKRVPKGIFGVYNTLCDFGWEVLKSTILEDDVSPIRSGIEGVELLPVVINTVSFSLAQIKEIKDKLKVTVNDVIVGVIFFGCRLYMKQTNDKSIKADSSALVLLNTRNVTAYKSVSEMVKPNSEMPWGNNFAFMNTTIPQLTDEYLKNPLEFVRNAHKLIKRKKNSAAVFLVGRLLEALRKFRGPEVTAKYIYNTLKHSSMGVSNVMGPVEQMALADHPIRGLYFTVVGAPQSIAVTMISYMGNLRMSFATEKGFIDPGIFVSCIQNSFNVIFKLALQGEH